ncbi:MAG: Nucleoside 2-deoxyribosyltransferase [candidate division WS6 bacterium OLB20]|uniref:Putative 2'-deoxynucleoside 5'-phosphate N-hydrolase 1 n=1 Tax=candidate division WS6 bacterium OLB20 TaxID=1617426 RepID=A0A136LZ01_9BACT|nr:MAG: Nucleoside 2-deoxyribosyltransferase [candidate division WS6 bacterium OLB20]
MKIYFAGSIRAGREDAELYAKIITLLQNHAEVVTEHIGSASLSEQGEVEKKDSFIRRRDLEWLESSDLVVAEVTRPSLGVGYELCYAEARNIPVLCLFRPGEKLLSAIIRGNDYFEVFEYSTIEDLEQFIPSRLAP